MRKVVIGSLFLSGAAAIAAVVVCSRKRRWL